MGIKYVTKLFLITDFSVKLKHCFCHPNDIRVIWYMQSKWQSHVMNWIVLRHYINPEQTLSPMTLCPIHWRCHWRCLLHFWISTELEDWLNAILIDTYHHRIDLCRTWTWFADNPTYTRTYIVQFNLKTSASVPKGFFVKEIKMGVNEIWTSYTRRFGLFWLPEWTMP